MPPPTLYSEAIFADYLTSVLGEVASLLGWDAGSVQVQEALNDALLDLDVSNIATVTLAEDIRKLRAVGRRAIWRAVQGATAGFYSITDNGQRLERQQIHDQARKNVESAEADCRALGADANYAVSVLSITRPHDPYVVLSDAERPL